MNKYFKTIIVTLSIILSLSIISSALISNYVSTQTCLCDEGKDTPNPEPDPNPYYSPTGGYNL